MPDERTPKEMHESTLAIYGKMLKDKHIDFAQFSVLVDGADLVYKAKKAGLADGALTNPEYIRNTRCGVCKGHVTARRILNGWIIKCNCAEVFEREFSPPNNKIWKRRYG